MSPDTYMNLFDRSKSTRFHSDLVEPHVMLLAMSTMLVVGKALDHIRKALFYGKKHEALTGNWHRSPNPFENTPDELHAVLGLTTESIELIERKLAGGLTKEDVLDEGGDVLWFLTLLFKTHGLSFSEVMEYNIEKLRKRYPEGFTQEAAIR